MVERWSTSDCVLNVNRCIQSRETLSRQAMTLMTTMTLFCVPILKAAMHQVDQLRW